MAMAPHDPRQPITLNAEIKNMGNTPLSSLETKVPSVGLPDRESCRQACGGNPESVIYPQTTETAQMQLPVTSLSAGEYWVKVDAMKAGRFRVPEPSVHGGRPPLANQLGQEHVGRSGHGWRQTHPNTGRAWKSLRTMSRRVWTIVQTSVTVGNPGNPTVNLRTSRDRPRAYDQFVDHHRDRPPAGDCRHRRQMYGTMKKKPHAHHAQHHHHL